MSKKLSPAMSAAYQRFIDAIDAGDEYMEKNPAIGGWTMEERWQIRAVHASSIHHKTFDGLVKRGLIRHVKDGFWTINMKPV